MTDERKTEPCNQPPSIPPGDMSDTEKLNEILLANRALLTRVGTLERESTQTRRWLDEIVLELLPRVEKLEAKVEFLAARVKVATEPCEECPLRASGA